MHVEIKVLALRTYFYNLYSRRFAGQAKRRAIATRHTPLLLCIVRCTLNARMLHLNTLLECLRTGEEDHEKLYIYSYNVASTYTFLAILGARSHIPPNAMCSICVVCYRGD